MTSRAPAGERDESSSQRVRRFVTEAARNRLQPGELLADKYIVERSSGRLAGCALVTVRHVELGQRFTLTYLPVRPCLRADQGEHFVDAARRALVLTGQHVARPFDAGRLPCGGAFAVSEHLEGTSVHGLIGMRGQLSVTAAADYALQAAEAVAEAHAHHFIHGTLGPRSIFLTSGTDGSPRVQVTGFGLHDCLRSDPLRAALLLSESAGCFDDGATFEELEWLSPEQVRLVPDLDVRADVWGLGVTLYAALSGRSPHAAPSVTLLLAAILADAPLPIAALRPELPPELDAVVLRCLAKDRNDRYATLADVASALMPFASARGRESALRIARLLVREHALAAANGVLFPVPAALEAPEPPRAPPSPRFQVIWTSVLVAFALAGGAIAGALGARGGAPALPSHAANVATAELHAGPSPSLRIEAAKPTEPGETRSAHAALATEPESSGAGSKQQEQAEARIAAQQRAPRDGTRGRRAPVVQSERTARSLPSPREVAPEPAPARPDLFDRMR